MPQVKFTERKTVQNPILKYAVDLGWQYVEPNRGLDFRDGETGIFFLQIFKEKLFEFNPWLDNENIEEIIRELLERTRYNIEGNQKVLNYCRGMAPVFSKKSGRELNVQFFDFENSQNNVFYVTDELSFTNGKAWNRFDLVFYINGLPVAVVETKNPEKEEGVNEALGQIKRYERESPEFMTYPLLFAASNLHDFIYGPTWNVEERYLYNWRGGKNLEEFETKQIGTKEALKKFEGLIQEINNARQEKKKLGLEEKDFAFYYALGDYVTDSQNRKEASHKISELFSQHSSWIDNPESGRILRRQLFSSLLPHVKKSDASLYVMNQIMTLEREIETAEMVFRGKNSPTEDNDQK